MAEELDSSILAIIGKASLEQQVLAPPLQKDVASRWAMMLENGILEEEKNTIIKAYPQPENCLLLETPKLNPEVAKALNPQIERRDEKLAGLQSQIGGALSAVGQLLTSFLQEEGGGNFQYIKLASDAAKLLLDFHHQQSITRRELITINLRKEFKETLTCEPAAGWLFGEKLGDRIKAAKELERSSLDLKQRIFKKPVARVPSVNNNSHQLNYRRPPRFSQQGGSQGGQQKRRQTAPQRRADPTKWDKRYTNQTNQDRKASKYEDRPALRTKPRYHQ